MFSSETNPTQTNNILNYVRDYFNSSEYLYTSPQQVQIINGKDEGIYAWISTNYFLDKYSSVSAAINL